MIVNEVCVIITARDAAKTISDAVRSSLALPEVKEVVVVDDDSSDSTGKIVQDIAAVDSRLRLITLTQNIGPAAARNLAIDQSNAPYISILDADDYFLPGRLTAMLKHRDWDLIADNIVFVSEDRPGIIPLDELPASRREYTLDITLEHFIRANIPSEKVERGELGFLKPIISRAFLDRFDLRYDENLRLGEDYDLYVRLLARGARFRVTSDVGYVARVRPGSLSGRHSSKDLGQLLSASRRHRALPLKKEDELALEDYLSHLRSRYLLHAFLELKRRKGLLAATLFSLKPPSNLPRISLGILKDKFGTRPAEKSEELVTDNRFLLPIK